MHFWHGLTCGTILKLRKKVVFFLIAIFRKEQKSNRLKYNAIL